MTTMITFRVDNDQGQMVDKSRPLDWIKRSIKTIYEDETGGNIGQFTITQTGDNEITAKNQLGQTMTWHFGGFDGYEVLEPEVLEWKAA